MPSHSFGTLLEFSVDGGAAFTELSEIVDIDAPGISVTQADASFLRVFARWKIFRNGLRDGGEVTFTMRSEGTSIGTLFSVFLNPFAGVIPLRSVTPLWRLSLPGIGQWLFFANVSAMQDHAPEDGVIDTDVTLKVTGNPTFTPGMFAGVAGFGGQFGPTG